jgi:hypothetical protein
LLKFTLPNPQNVPAILAGMGKNSIQTAPASGEANIPDENQSQTRLPSEYESRFESGQELKIFLDEKELLRRLPVSRRTVFAWRKNGKLPCVRIGRRNLFHWPSVESALLRLQQGAE